MKFLWCKNTVSDHDSVLSQNLRIKEITNTRVVTKINIFLCAHLYEELDFCSYVLPDISLGRENICFSSFFVMSLRNKVQNLNHLRDLKKKLPTVPANSPGYFAYSLVEKL